MFYCQYCNAEKETKTGPCGRCHRFQQAEIDQAFTERNKAFAERANNVPWKPEPTIYIPLKFALRIADELNPADADLKAWIEHVRSFTEEFPK